MWRLLEQAAKSATANATGYVSTVQEKAQSLVATVQDEASTLLHAIGSARTGPVDEILYEEIDAYKEFTEFFSAEEHSNEIAQAMAEDEEIRELHEALVPVELSFEEFWCRYFFRRQQSDERELLEQQRRQYLKDAETVDGIRLPEFDDEDEDTDDMDGEGSDDKLTLDDERPKAKKSPEIGADASGDGGADQEGLWLLRAARDAERRAAAQWRNKARELHRELQSEKQAHADEVGKVKQDLEERYMSLCDAYEARMTEATTQIDDARAGGYDAGIRESEDIIATMRQTADDELNRLRAQLAADGDAALVGENAELKQALNTARERVAELEKNRDGDELEAKNSSLEQSVAETKKEMELWRMRALKMKKLKDLIQTELNAARQANASAASGEEGTENDASSDPTAQLRARISSLESQVAEATANAQVREKEAYDKGVAAGRAETEEKAKAEVAQAFERGVEKGAADSSSEIGVLRAELSMFRAFHESAAHIEIPTAGVSADDSLDDISLADGVAPCSPGSSVSVFTDNGFGAAAKPADDWGEW